MWDFFQTHYQINPSVTRSLFKFRPRRMDDGTRITCRAENEAMVGSAIEDHVDMRVMCKCITGWLKMRTFKNDRQLRQPGCEEKARRKDAA